MLPVLLQRSQSRCRDAPVSLQKCSQSRCRDDASPAAEILPVALQRCYQSGFRDAPMLGAEMLPISIQRRSQSRFRDALVPLQRIPVPLQKCSQFRCRNAPSPASEMRIVSLQRCSQSGRRGVPIPLQRCFSPASEMLSVPMLAILLQSYSQSRCRDALSLVSEMPPVRPHRRLHGDTTRAPSPVQRCSQSCFRDAPSPAAEMLPVPLQRCYQSRFGEPQHRFNLSLLSRCASALCAEAPAFLSH